MEPKKKLTRDVDNKIIAGVIAGFAHYYHQDVTLFRLLAIFGIVLTGLFPGVFLYIIAWLIMPA